MAATVEILGVYQLDVTPEVFAAQLPRFADENECRDHFSSVVLIEAIANEADDRLDLADFFQPNPAFEHSQAPWDEGLLSADGQVLLAREMNCVKGNGRLRFAFYIHFWDPRLPLRWTYGETQCPVPQPMPDRLKLLMPYNPV